MIRNPEEITTERVEGIVESVEGIVESVEGIAKSVEGIVEMVTEKGKMQSIFDRSRKLTA
jgi:methyl-accepting chemotaxis protein